MDMQQVIKNFKINDFNKASVDFFKYLNVPINQLIEDSIDINDLLGENKTFEIVDTTYMIGGIDDNVFQDRNTKIELKPQRYDGLLIFAINLNITNPTRTQLSNISRIFNRKFEYTPVVILFKYDNKLSLSNTQRQEYSENQKWRDGEKVGKVSILRDIEIDNSHRGHIDILEKMKLSSKINNYEELYSYWQEVFDVSILNKKFYQELQHWYFYAINEVTYPNEPLRTDHNYSDELRKEYIAKNIIRLLTRLLFVWFIKEKGLIPNKLFEENEIKDILKEFDPKKLNTNTLFAGQDKRSFYYKAILQNLFFATLNQEMGKREFRKEKQHQNISNLMRYKNYFKNPDDFIHLVERIVPFMNGGLFECLDTPHPTKKGKKGGSIIEYEDGFSDREDNALIVPDYIFFGLEEHVDLSVEYGNKNKAFKNASVKGLINILNSYKFTVAENTPIEEDIALDPELLGKVFENLLASYNPETKTTARKQTGSFYTPREIVGYMVDESLIAYLKTKLKNYENEEELDLKLHKLVAYNDIQPFENEEDILKIINAIDTVKILDPAVGSGAFPMGTLQKMVYLLHKLDPDNKHWFDLQFEKANKETSEVFKTKDKQQREDRLREINDAFDIDINHPDYARKLYLIENTIFGVDIQPIAIQISKLRFFISLVVEQNVNNDKANFGIRPLPNLESKFVTANTLIGIEKVEGNLFDKIDIKELEKELKEVRHKIFNAKTPKTKSKLRDKDKELREQISIKLIENGLANNTAQQLASWNPYDQNASSLFFDMEWMFGIEDGFDIVIGNPPYGANLTENDKKLFKKIFSNVHMRTLETFNYFISKSFQFLKKDSYLSFIVPNNLLFQNEFEKTRKYFLNKQLVNIVNLGDSIFENVNVPTCIFGVQNIVSNNDYVFKYIDIRDSISLDNLSSLEFDFHTKINNFKVPTYIFGMNNQTIELMEKIKEKSFLIDEIAEEVASGISTGGDKIFRVNNDTIASNNLDIDILENVLVGREINKYIVRNTNHKVIYIPRNIIVSAFQNTLNYLESYRKKLEQRSETKKGILPWYALNRHRYKELFLEDKIILRQTSDSIISVFDNEGYYVLDSILILKIKKKFDIEYKYITAILNSKLTNFIYKNITGETGRTFAQVKPKNVRKLYIPKISKKEQGLFVNIVNYIMHSVKNNELIARKFESILDGMVYELCFQNHMEEKQINIIEFVKKDIQKVFKNETFENLNELEKLERIKELYSEWIHPDNEVRNRLKLFAVRSPDILRPILETS